MSKHRKVQSELPVLSLPKLDNSEEGPIVKKILAMKTIGNDGKLITINSYMADVGTPVEQSLVNSRQKNSKKKKTRVKMKNTIESVSFPLETDRHFLSDTSSNQNKNMADSKMKDLNISEHTRSLMKEEELRPFEEELKFVEEFIKNENEIENEHLTSQYFMSVRTDEIISCVLALISVGSGIVYYELKTDGPGWEGVNREVLDMATNASINLVSIGVGLFLITMIFKYINYLKLYRTAKYNGSKDGIFQTDLWRYCILEFVLCAFHPNRGFHGMTYVTDPSWNLYEIEYGINDFLMLILLCRTLYIIKTIVILSKFYSDRADRVTKLMGNRLSFFFSFKCMVIKYPFHLLISLVVIVSFTLAYILRIIEGPVYYKLFNGSNVVLNDFRNFANCMWNMLITITTVGYGDYYPNSVLGRLVIVLTAFVGIILLSLVISFLQNTVRLTEHEQKAYDFISRLEAKENIRTQAVKCFERTFKYYLEKRKYLKYARGTNVNYKTLNKKRTLLLDAAYKKIKNKREFKEILHNFQNIYGAPNDVDLINKKIDELEETMIKGSKHTNILENRLNSILEYTSTLHD